MGEHEPRGTVPRILNLALLAELAATFRLASQLIKVYNKMMKTVRRVETKKMAFCLLGKRFAANLQTDLIA